MTFRQPADGTRLAMPAMGDLRKHRDGLPVSFFYIHNMKLEVALIRKGLGEALRLMRVIDPAVNPQSEIEAIRLVAKADENIPQPKRVLAAGNRDQDLLMVGEHFILFDKALGLLGNPFEVMILAQRQFVLAHVDRSLRSTFFTFHIFIPKHKGHEGLKEKPLLPLCPSC